MIEVLAPCSGQVVALSEVPDPVFAREAVGSGVAIDPPREMHDVVAPCDGKLLKIHPHAFVVLHADGKGVLVHLGIDTVTRKGDGFEVLATQGETVVAGTPVIRWNPAVIEEAGLSPIVPVVIMETKPGAVVAAERTVAVGDQLFTI